jgi:hypothetical protein
MLAASGAAGTAGDAVVLGPGGAVSRVSGFGFGTGSAAQQQRRQGGVGAAAAAAAAGSGGGASSSSAAGSRVWLVLQHAPCLIPFQDRVMLFQAVVSEEKESAAVAAAAAAGAGSMFTFDDPMGMFMGGAQENRFVTIRCAACVAIRFAACVTVRCAVLRLRSSASVLASPVGSDCGMCALLVCFLTDSNCASGGGTYGRSQ